MKGDALKDRSVYVRTAGDEDEEERMRTIMVMMTKIVMQKDSISRSAGRDRRICFEQVAAAYSDFNANAHP